MEVYEPDRSLKGKLRRRAVRLLHRRPARKAPPGPMISFSFDDAPLTAATIGAQVGRQLGGRGMAGEDSAMGPILTSHDVVDLIAGGHEIGCHTWSHLDCGQASAEAAAADADRNAAALNALGARPATFAYPYGDVSAPAKAALADRYSLLQALHHGVIVAGTDLNQAPAVGIEGPDGEAIARRWLAESVRRNAWLILYTHDVAEQPSAWGCTPQTLERLADEAIRLGCRTVTVAEGARLVA